MNLLSIAALALSGVSLLVGFADTWLWLALSMAAMTLALWGVIVDERRTS